MAGLRSSAVSLLIVERDAKDLLWAGMSWYERGRYRAVGLNAIGVSQKQVTEKVKSS
jgi:hypothetical protein